MPAVFATCLMAISLWAAVARAAETWVDAAVNTRLVRNGEPFRLALTAGGRNAWPLLPGKNHRIPGCQVLAYAEKDTSSRHAGYVVRQGVYTLAMFSSEDVLLPPFRILFREPGGNTLAAQSEPIVLGLRSVRPAGGLALMDPRPPRPPFPWHICGAAAAGMTGMYLLYLLRQRQRFQTSRAKAFVSADQIAEQALDLFEAKRGQMDARQQTDALSGILRRFLISRFGLPARFSSAAAWEQGLPAAIHENQQIINKDDSGVRGRKPPDVDRKGITGASAPVSGEPARTRSLGMVPLKRQRAGIVEWLAAADSARFAPEMPLPETVKKLEAGLRSLLENLRSKPSRAKSNFWDRRRAV